MLQLVMILVILLRQNHYEIYNVTANFINLMYDYREQEDVNELRDLIRKKNKKRFTFCSFIPQFLGNELRVSDRWNRHRIRYRTISDGGECFCRQK